jgi:hypothetical protein
MAGLLDSLSDPNGADPAAGLLSFLASLQKNAPPTQTGPMPSDVAQYGQPAMASAPVFAGSPVASATPQASAQPSPLDNAQYPYGPIGAPSQANAQMIAPQPAIPSQPPVTAQPATQPPTPGPGIGNNLMAGYENLRHGGGLIGSVVAALTGQRNDPYGVQLQQQQQAANLTARALVAKGVNPQIALAAVAPGNTEFLKTLVTQTFGPQPVTPLGQGYVADKNGNVRRAYEPDDVNQVVQIGESPMGGKQYGIFNKGDGTIKPYNPPGGANAGSGGLGDMSKTGADYLATVPPAQRGILQGMIDGTIQPPSSFALSKPYWQTMLAAAKNLDPTFDENTWASRHKMSTDIASSGNSSMGGILANGKSSFSHLADLSDSMAGLGNASHDFPGGGVLATAQNYIGNSLGGSVTKAKIKAINDNLGHYGQESTKFYSGTGGGAEERMIALKEMNPAYTSSEEMAAYLSKEKDLMLARLREKEDDIRKTMGDQYLQQHPVFTPQFQATIDRIDANIAKLNGKPAPSKVGSSPLAPGQSTVVNGITVKRVN